MKSILFILDTVEIGGATKLTFDLIRNLNREKFRYKIIYLNDKRYGSEDLLDYYDFKKSSELLWFKNLRPLRRIFYMYKNFRKYDMIHSCMEQANIYSSFVKMLPFSNFKLAITYHGLDSTYTNDLSKIKPEQLSYSRALIMKHLQNILFKYVDVFIAVCQSIKEYMTINRKINKEKIQVIYHGLNIESITEQVNKSRETDIESRDTIKEFRIGYIGRLGYSKGLEGFFESLPQLLNLIPSLKVFVKGNGELKEYLLEKTRELSLENVISFEDFGEDIFEFYNKIDLMILPSFYETTNLTVLEAMYSGTPVLTSDAGGLPEIINNNENGFMFKNGDFKELTNKIFEISMLSNDKINDINKKAFKTVTEKFNFNKNSFEIEKIFEELINSR